MKMLKVESFVCLLLLILFKSVASQGGGAKMGAVRHHHLGAAKLSLHLKIWKGGSIF